MAADPWGWPGRVLGPRDQREWVPPWRPLPLNARAPAEVGHHQAGWIRGRAAAADSAETLHLSVREQIN